MQQIWNLSLRTMATIKTVALKFIIVISLCLVFVNNAKGQYATNQWDNYTWINPLPQGNTLNAVVFADENIVFAAGNNGTVLRSIDKGDSWEILNTNVSTKLLGLHFLNTQFGVASGIEGTVIVTTNGGNSWSDISPNSTEILYDVHFTDEQTGIVCGSAGNIFRTIDGGTSWQSLNYGSELDLFSIEFPTNDTGYIVGGNLSGYILKSTDKGMSWTIIDSIPYNELRTIDCINADTIYIAGESGYIGMSTNGGYDWIQLVNSYGLHRIDDIHFINKQTGFCCTRYGAVLRTVDGGNDWVEMNTPDNSELYSTGSNSEDNVIIVGKWGFMIRSTDHGTSFSKISEGDIMTLAVFAQYQGTISAIGFGCRIFTEDGGANWETQYLTSFEDAIDFHFPDSAIGYAMNDQHIFKTINGGVSWTIVGITPDRSGKDRYSVINGIYMVTDNHGFIYGGGESNGGGTWATLYETWDGEHWTEVYCPLKREIWDCEFVDEYEGYLMDNTGLYKTTNSGQGWFILEIPLDMSYLQMVYFYNKSTGFLIGKAGWKSYILKTSSGGNDWEIVYEHDGFYPLGITFINHYTGYITMSSGKVLQTNDGGISWDWISTCTGHSLFGIYPLTDSSGFLLGAGGTMISYGEINLGTSDYSWEENLEIEIYPNPASNEVNIRSSLFGPRSSVFIYDMFGRLMDEIMVPQDQEESLVDVSGYPEGIYIAVLRNDSGIIGRRKFVVAR